MSTNIPVGVSSVEGVANGLSPFNESDKHNIGLLMERERGVLNFPVLITSLQEDRKVFGDPELDKYGAYVTRHIFNNAGSFGAQIYGVRIADGTSVAATGNFTDGEVSPTTIFTVTAGHKGLEDPGTWANTNLKVKGYPQDDPAGLAGKYLFEIYYKNVLVESFEAETWASLITQVNERSYYVFLTAGTLTADITDIEEVTLSGGTYVAPDEADYAAVPDEISPTGLACLDTVNVQIVAVTDIQTLTMAQSLRTYCNAHQNKPIGVACMPYQSTSTEVATFADGLQSNNADCLAVYNAWVKTQDGFDSTIWVPALGCILGAGYIRVPEQNRSLIFYPPAGVDSSFVDVIDISPNNVTQAIATTWAKRYSVNSVIFKRGYGHFIFTSRTVSTNKLYHSINIRRLTSFYLQTLEDNLQWAVQKPATSELRRQIYASIWAYFRGQYNDGALEQTLPFEEACVIDVAADNLDRKIQRVTVDYVPTETAESIRIELNRNDGVLVAVETVQ